MDLRPRSSAELVDAAVRLLRRHHAQFLMVAAIGVAPFAGTILVGRGMGSGTAGAVLSVAAAAATAWMLVVDSALHIVAADAYHGRAPSATRALGATLSRVGAVLATRVTRLLIAVTITVLAALAYGTVMNAMGSALPVRSVVEWLGAALFLATVLGVALALSRFTMTPAALLLEELPIGAAFHRGAALARGRIPHVALAMALVWVPTAAVAFGMLVVLGVFDADGWLVIVMVVVVFGAAEPLSRVLATLQYFDLRIRKEGYDIELLAATLRPPPVAAPGGAMPTLPAEGPASTF